MKIVSTHDVVNQRIIWEQDSSGYPFLLVLFCTLFLMTGKGATTFFQAPFKIKVYCKVDTKSAKIKQMQEILADQHPLHQGMSPLLYPVILNEENGVRSISEQYSTTFSKEHLRNEKPRQINTRQYAVA